MRRLALLALVVLLGWAAWATLYSKVQLKSHAWEAELGVLARLVFWVAPAFTYLAVHYGRRWSAPLGLGFPYGPPQVIRSAITLLVVGGLLLLGTSVQFGTTPGLLWEALREHGHAELKAPIFEELIFRGVITSEALTWASQSSRDLNQLRRRFWAAQLASAAVFVLLHWPYYLLTRPLTQVLTDSLSLLVTALVLGFSFAQTRSIYVCMALHWLNNALSTLQPLFAS